MAAPRSPFFTVACVFVALLAAADASLAADAPHPALGALDRGGTWKIVPSPREFGPENLYEEIDGEAELFLPYGMKRLTVAHVSERSRPGEEVRVELYRMGSPRDAYGIWSQHRYPDQELLGLPSAEAVISDTSADFFRGDTFVRLRAKPGESSRRLVVGLARDVAAVLPGDGAAPAEAGILERFPARIRGTVIYQKRAMLGYECLAPGFEARFEAAEGSGRVVLLPPAAEGTEARLSRLSRELPGHSEAGPGFFRAKLPSGTLWIFPSGDCVVGVAGGQGGAEARRILEKLAADAKSVCGPAR